MMKAIKKGFYVTELFGHGVDLVTGQYSRGASGFWIEKANLPIRLVKLLSVPISLICCHISHRRATLTAAMVQQHQRF